jgi:hypothetical protein
MATNKMRLRHAYRMGGDDFLEDHYGVRFDKEDKNLHRQINNVLEEDKEIQQALLQEDKKSDEKELLEKMEYLETLDINQLRSILKSTLNTPNKNAMKMKKEEIIVELLK